MKAAVEISVGLLQKRLKTREDAMLNLLRSYRHRIAFLPSIFLVRSSSAHRAFVHP
jgi:hypothetical protein